MSLALFIPVRKGSERVKEKNTRRFSDFSGGLLELKLQQLAGLSLFEEIIISTNDEKCIEIAKNFIGKLNSLQIIHRPEELGSSETKLNDLIKYVGKITDCDDILWTHVTSPFCDAESYKNAIQDYKNLKDHDSLMSVEILKEFIWNRKEKKISNSGDNKWPRTQDLEEVIQINSAIFIAPKLFYKTGNRIGNNPFLFEMNKIHSWDVDTEDDFKIAEAIYDKFYR